MCRSSLLSVAKEHPRTERWSLSIFCHHYNIVLCYRDQLKTRERTHLVSNVIFPDLSLICSLGEEMKKYEASYNQAQRAWVDNMIAACRVSH